MPAQAVASATLTCYGYGACPKCSSVGDLYGLCASVIKGEDCRHSDVRLCIDCLCKEAPFIKIKMSDVMEINTKSSRRVVNKLARKRERTCAEEIGGSITPASGAGVAKGDARNDVWMIDDKFTQYRTFSLREDVVVKTICDAKRTGRRGALKVGFRKGEGLNAAVLDWEDFMELINGEG